MKQKTEESLASSDQHFATLLKMKISKALLTNVIALCIVCCISCDGSKKQVAREASARVESLPYYRDASFTPYWIDEGSASLDTFHTISPFTLINQLGDTITKATFHNKVYVVDFFFTFCPGICPKMTDNMLDIQDAFLEEEDILLLSHSVTPSRDSVPVLQAYADRKGILSHKWHLATGQRKDIYKLGRRDYFIEEDLGTERDLDEFLHTENFVLIDRKGHLRGIYNGLNKQSVQQLIADAKTLL